MSLKIIKAGIYDTVQDRGRFGYQQLGINPGGVMDRFSSALANAVLGKNLRAPVLELHFPAAHLLFNEPNIISITGADFMPMVNSKLVPMYHPIQVKKGDVLSWQKCRLGARAYVSFLNELVADHWLGSYSTNVLVQAGGHKGKKLEKGDELAFNNQYRIRDATTAVLPWSVRGQAFDKEHPIHFLKGSEWNWLHTDAKQSLEEDVFYISSQANRMGYRLTGNELGLGEQKELVSSPVDFGTMQLLPNGQVIVLMADHQTTGGYPRIGCVTSADLSILAQRSASDAIRFAATDIQTAERKLMEQNTYLDDILLSCKYKLEAYL